MSVLDEAGMAATRPTARLLEAAQRAGAKVVAIGDPGQLASVQAGGWLRAVGRALGALRLTEVMRQRDPAERRALGALHDGHPSRYLDWAERDGRIETFSDPAGACEQAVGEWARAAAAAGPAQAVMIARDNDTRDAAEPGCARAAARPRRARRGALLRQHRGRGRRPGDLPAQRRTARRGQRDARHRPPPRPRPGRDRHRQRPACASCRRAYVAEHVEHAYSLTGHGMQGGTVESAIVVASPSDLTAGWSYTALSRAQRNHTPARLRRRPRAGAQRVRTHRPNPEQQPDTSCSTRVGRRMLERDDEDLAIEQLPGAGRADDPDLAGTRAHATDLSQEHAAARAEPTSPAAANLARLRELRERVDQLHVQLAALPTRELQRIEDLDARALTLTTQREQLTERLVGLPEPRRRAGREQDPHAIERAHLTSALQAGERELHATVAQRRRMEHELSNPVEARAERDSVDRALAQLTRERTILRNQLAERELQNPGAWVTAALGERPEQTRAREAWETAVRHAVRYRAEHTITDPTDPFGPRPAQREQLRDWERARTAIDRAGRRLGRDVGVDRDGIDVGIGL